ncbi:MAG TPA: zinc-binding dehydrogenase [Candidatus Dormibacteraeota bacterium]|jgi:NADPH2:quinone reductase|nr:zinc-binding dehydrogenase [Candidatus Dormibacteraeota bacterium]
MRVMQAMRFGGPEVIVEGEAPDPVPGPGQAVIRTAVADVLFLDTQIRRGLMGEAFHVVPPYVPGSGVGGEVVRVGEGVEAAWVGRRVIAGTAVPVTGGYAELAVAEAAALRQVPAALSVEEGTALLHDGSTALALIRGTEVGPGRTVLVLNAAGGLGLLLVQMAHAAGARVVGAAGGGRKLDLVRDQGADDAVDYTEPVWPGRAVELAGRRFDIVLDGAGGEFGCAALEVTADGGRFSAHGAAAGDFSVPDHGELERRGIELTGIELVQFSPEQAARLGAEALEEAAAGRIRPLIGQTLPLARAAEAHAALESRRVVGKTLLTIDGA